MRLGLHVGYWGLGLTAEEQIEVVKEAESAGYDSVWAAEAYGSDTATVLAWIAGQTDRIRIGSAILQIPGRTPAMTAMTAATLDHLSNGRMILGIGSSGPQVAEGWHGQRFPRQLKRTREYVDILRKALARERLEYEGEQYTLPLPDGPGKALKLMIGPVQEKIPIYIAAIGPKNTQHWPGPQPQDRRGTRGPLRCPPLLPPRGVGGGVWGGGGGAGVPPRQVA